MDSLLDHSFCTSLCRSSNKNSLDSPLFHKHVLLAPLASIARVLPANIIWKFRDDAAVSQIAWKGANLQKFVVVVHHVGHGRRLSHLWLTITMCVFSIVQAFSEH